jgi:SAM-dependent methyltransferase
VRAEDLAEHYFRAAIGMFDILTLYLGDRLGFYRALADAGPMTSHEVADRTGTHERYVREWLEHQAVSGILEVDDPGAEPTARRFRLPPEHSEVLANRDSLMYQAFKGVDMVRATRPLPDLVEAFRSGEGLAPTPWQPEGRPDFNRAIFLNRLGREWLPAITDVDERLRADPPARVADLGCGTGWSSLAMAQAYPKIVVDGFDLSEEVIELASANASDTGFQGRVTFRATDVATLEGTQRYDLVTVIEALHDMAHPVEALRAARNMLLPGGCVVVADEPVAETFAAPGDETERYTYGWSVVSCLPYAMGEPDAAGTGAVMRPSTLRSYAEAAGFQEMQIVPIEPDVWRFYRLLP